MYGSDKIIFMSLIDTPLLASVFLVGFFVLTYCTSSLIYFGKFRSKELASSVFPSFFRFLRPLSYPNSQWESLYFSLSFAKLISLVLTLILGYLFLDANSIYLLTAVLITHLVAHLGASTKSTKAVKGFASIASIYLTLLSPLIFPFSFFRKKLEGKEGKQMTPSGERLKEMILSSDLHHHLETSDQKQITAFIKFKERVAKEIMVPRVDLFALSSSTTIREASHLFSQEGYSRVPVYKETLDQIVGVVLYKDLLKRLTEKEPRLDETLETLFKPVLYSPENKKVPQLLQEFRTKQIHMAIIVDEYGGTEGIVTIEDILEELVGEIEDEYDVDEENPFWEIPGGGWIIDAKMTLLDIEQQIGVHLPTHPGYDTLGGYVYHCAGTIPAKGWRLSHDKFDLEVVSSSERAIKKIKIEPRIAH